jgi:hypothetical protein
MTLSDGVSFVPCLIQDKVFNQFDPQAFERACKYTVVRLNARSLVNQSVGQKSVFVLKHPFEVIYTGLRRLVGSPQDYMKNRDENSFPANYDLRIPVEESHQRKPRSGPADAASEEDNHYEKALVGMDNMEVRSPINGARNLQQKRVGGPSVQEHFGSAGKLTSERQRPSLGGDDDAKLGFMPLSCMNTFAQDWVIKCKVLKKQLRTWSN